jgi:hypothetical protein
MIRHPLGQCEIATVQSKTQATLIEVEANGVEYSLQTLANRVQFTVGDVADAADVAAAKVIDDEIETIAGVLVRGSVDLIARLGAYPAMLIISMSEDETANLSCSGAGAAWSTNGRLCRALPIGAVRGNTKVKERSAEGRVGMRVEADVGNGTQLGVVGSVAGIQMKSADLGIPEAKIPGCWHSERNTIAAIAERVGGWNGRLSRRSRGLHQ